MKKTRWARARRRTTSRTSATRHRRERQHRRRHDHLQLRRLEQTPDHDRRRRVHRQRPQLVAPVTIGEGATSPPARRSRGRAGRRAPSPAARREQDGWGRKQGADSRGNERPLSLSSATRDLTSYVRNRRLRRSPARRPRHHRRPSQLEYRGYDSAGIAVVEHDGLEVAARRQADQPRRRHRARAARRHLRHRPHPLGHPRPADRGERAPAPRLHRPHRRRPQRHHRELSRAEAQLQAEGHTFETETDTEIIAHLVESEWTDDGLENAVRARCSAARALRARAALRRRSRQDRRRAQRPAGRDRHRRRRILRRLGRPGDPAATRATCSSWPTGDGRAHPRRRHVTDFDGADRARSADSASPGIPIRRRRAATSTSCSRKSTSSRAPSAKPSSAASRRRPAQVFLDEMSITAEDVRSAIDKVRSSPAARPGTPRWSASS